MRNLPQRRKRLHLSPRQRNRSLVKIPTRAMQMKRRRAKKKKRRNRKPPKARQQRKRQRDQGLRGAGPDFHSTIQLVSPHQEDNPQSNLQRVRPPWRNPSVLRCKLFQRKSHLFVCCDILCARARARHCSSTTFLLPSCAARFNLRCIFPRCCVAICGRPRAKMAVKEMVLVVLRAKHISKNVHGNN